MFRTSSALVGLAALALSALPGCGGSSSSNTPVPMSTVNWTLSGVESLAAGYQYEGWVIVGGNPVSTGRFDVDGAGMPSQVSVTMPTSQIGGATAFVLSIEPAVDPDPGPANTKLLGGDFAAGQATLAVSHAAALGDDFAASTGSFILATPTSALTTDENQGIWWLDPTGSSPVAALQLPTLPAGWVYEGWVVDGAGPVSTGRFTNVSAADSDGDGPASGTQAGPPFPGQDFINPGKDLVNLTAVISVEPEPDDGAAPFTLKPLVMGSIGAATAPTLQAMSNNAASSNPTGTATITAN